MKQNFWKQVIPLILVNLCLSACVTSKIKSLPLVATDVKVDTTAVTIFLLERDIPQDIERLGVVSIAVNARPTLNIDQQVKQQLQRDCQQLGANGAYRVNDGTYYPMIVNYLVFKYKK